MRVLWKGSQPLVGLCNLLTEEEDMESPLHKRHGDIKSDLSYLFIVLCLASHCEDHLPKQKLRLNSFALRLM